MAWNGFLEAHDCKGCGKPLQGDGSGRPAELYAGTYTGLCYNCENSGPCITRTDSDGAQHWDCPPHCPAWRRDREFYIGYADCAECKGQGRHYVSRANPQGGPYYRHCETCFQRYCEQPIRKAVSVRYQRITRAAHSVWDRELKRRKLWRAAKRKEQRDSRRSLRGDTRAYHRAIQAAFCQTRGVFCRTFEATRAVVQGVRPTIRATLQPPSGPMWAAIGRAGGPMEGPIMKHVRFYLEHETARDKRNRKHNGNVIAVVPANRCPDGAMEALGAVFFYPDSPVASTAASREYLSTKCRRIPERMAREIHPALFERLDVAD